MRVLQICSKPPLPAIDGGCKASDNITQGLLTAGVQVKVLTLATHKHPFIHEAYSEDYISKTDIEHTFINTQIKIKDAFLNLFGTKSYNIERFYSKEFERQLVEVLHKNEYDAVLLDGLYVTPYLEAIRMNCSSLVVYRAHNVESEIWERNAQEESGPKKKYIQLLAKRLKNYEQNIMGKFDGIAAITEKDKQQLSQLGGKNIEVFPFGIDLSKYVAKSGDPNSLFYIGSMDWLPNINGIQWFLKEVWDKVSTSSTLSFHLAGRSMPDTFKSNTSNGLKVHGEVEDALAFMNAYQIMLVPLFSGSGMRVKIIEALALGKLVIATSVALEGINCEHNKNVVVANSSSEFIEAIQEYTSNADALSAVASAGRELVATNYDNQVIVNNLVTFINQLNT